MPPKKPHNSKKWIKYTAIITLVIMVLQLLIYIQYGSIDVKGTLATQYHNTKNPSQQIIETQHFSMLTPKHWVHVLGGYGTEGNPFGSFITRKGIIHYEYGLWSPSYQQYSQQFENSPEERIINRFNIQIIQNKKEEKAIIIPMQNEMKYPFCFYMDRSIANNFDEIISGIKEIEFK